MSTNYDVYLKSVTRLAATIVLKDEICCEIINDRLVLMGIEVDPLDKTTWKYYLNLAGKYHRTNVPMKIVSMDTAEEIDFTVENMVIHRRTWREYQYGSRYYNEVIEKYPRQKELINGILNPVDINAAIAADDHSILYYDATLVESRETNLIPKLQEWIIGNFVRYGNVDYRINNGLFIATRLMILFMAMPSAILNIRLENCRTHMVHSYHIKRYLASFGPLDSYYEYMNEFQRLYFYRDIRYLMRNNGKNETFETLTKNVMTKRKFPLAHYSIQQNDNSLPAAFDPVTQLERRSLNGIPSALGDDIKSVPQMLALQASVATGNVDETVYAEDYVPALMERNLASFASTKILESNVLDLKESEPYTLTDILLNQWIYLADKKRYSAVVTLTLPNGGEAAKLSMKDAWVLYQYLYMRRSGWELITVPQIMAKRIRRDPMPTFEELRGICSYEHVDDAFVTEALRNNVEITAYVSVDSFVQMCMSVHVRMLEHRDLYAWRNDFYVYGEVKQMTDRIYADVPVDMYVGENYAEWLSSRNIVIEDLSVNDIDAVMASLLAQATGADLKISLSLKDIHKAMLGIMSQLSSYSVQFIQQINDEAVVMFDWPHLRYHDKGGHRADSGRLEVPVTKPFSVDGIGRDMAFIDMDNVKVIDLESYTKHQAGVEIGVVFEMSGKKEYIDKGMVVGAQITALSIPTVDLASVLTGQDIGLYTDLIPIPTVDLFNKVITDDFQSP
jgi:hypothetical protein